MFLHSGKLLVTGMQQGGSMTKNWFLVDEERMLLTEEEAEEYDGDGCDVVAENTMNWQEYECTCRDYDPGRPLCYACQEEERQKRSEEIPYE